ncbi:NAD(P) transhydrogenase subunit beta [Planctomycetes bacterium Pan216]|uniref:NAD(P) transhydrogenase subunit beta n=1 Tax=Kolteria novifilia TaxID=2527975 RepID=A0A518B5L2_9BACT|nr:NAD(P) transhydrogenase subunit beta [Planctomycetes bacterium Pan216]
MPSSDLINLAYLAAAVLFIFGLKGLTHPRTAVRGNALGALGMLLAVVVTLLDRQIIGFWTIALGLLVGAGIGILLAVRIQMTAMPQLVALFNGFGGAASALVAGATLADPELFFTSGAVSELVASVASGIIGAVTFWGSLIAFAKLQELISGKPYRFPGQQPLNIALLVVMIILLLWTLADPGRAPIAFWLGVVAASAFGVMLVLPVGGADMPVVIALLNSLSGLAASAVGFVLSNSVLIISGSLVGSAGFILTVIMCKAMNRSLLDVMLGSLGSAEQDSGEEIYQGKITSTSADEVAMLLESSQRVCIVPGYGLAVAQAQHAVRDLTEMLEEAGLEVYFAIHPVAGRMPGHMNVLLAEAKIDYEQLKDMDQANPLFAQTDVVLIIGANDVVNPLARDPASAIAGMPILDVDKARTVVVIKRSLSPGFAGIANPLFVADNTMMLFADAQKALIDLIAALDTK